MGAYTYKKIKRKEKKWREIFEIIVKKRKKMNAENINQFMDKKKKF